MFLPRIPGLANRGYTYVFIPRDFLRDLFGTYGMDLPAELMKPVISPSQFPANETIPSNIDLSTISSIGELLSVPSHSSYLTRALQGYFLLVTLFNSSQTSHLTWVVNKDGRPLRRSSSNSTPISMLIVSPSTGMSRCQMGQKLGLDAMPQFACKSTNLGLLKHTTHPPCPRSFCGSSGDWTTVPRYRRVELPKGLDTRALGILGISMPQERTLCSRRFTTGASIGFWKPI